MNNIPVGILGASGYAGRELCALVAAHPALSLAFATADRRRGETVRLRAPYGAAAGPTDVTFVATDDAPLGDAALVFSALPHGASASWSQRAYAAGAKVVDLSSDLRPGHLTQEILSTLIARRTTLASVARGGSDERPAMSDERGIPYGLTELAREAVAAADVVANPGCYPTAILTALVPLARAGLLARGATVVADAASGVTGAGNSPREDLLFGEVAESFRAYGVGNGHRHLPEMRSTLGALGADVDLIFTPHLLPVARGILATCTVPVTGVPADALAIWRDAYAGEPFIEVVDELPTLAEVQHRNVVRITARRVEGVRTPTLLVFAAIDNLVKGAAGQALQNANLMLGLDEAAGLPR
jgi:N-acetyl-gamma-glutamyl-phosphate reductase